MTDETGERLNQPLDKVTRYSLLALAVAQGYLLYFLHLSVQHASWPALDPRWLMALYVVVIGLPAFFYYGIARINDRRNAYAGALALLLLLWLGWHLGWESSSVVEISDGGEWSPFQSGLLWPFIFSVGTILFILAFLFRAYVTTGVRRLNYQYLRAIAWQNALISGFLLLFVGVFFLLLILWASLFDLLGIKFFSDLFGKAAFAYPVYFLVGGIGLVLIRGRLRFIATVRFMCEVLTKSLLPLLSLIVVLFIVTLPFVGVDSIREAGFGSKRLIAVSLILLFFFNVVHDNEKKGFSYPQLLRWFVSLSIIILPVLSVLVFWGVGVRISQHGLTSARLWVVLIQSLVTLYCVTYAVFLLWKRKDAGRFIKRTNIIMACVIVVVLILVNTPLLDFQNISVNNQVERLVNGQTQPDDVDLKYLRFDSGRYGVEALTALKHSGYVSQRAVLQRRISAVLKSKKRWMLIMRVDTTSPDAIRRTFTVIPVDATPPDSLLLWLANSKRNPISCLIRGDIQSQCHLVKIEALDEKPAWVLFNSSYANLRDGNVLQKSRSDASGWHKVGKLLRLCDRCQEVELGKHRRPLQVATGEHLVFVIGSYYFLFKPNLSFFLENIRKHDTAIPAHG